LFKNDKPQEASEAISHALEQGTKDSQLFFHAGMIYEKLGDSLKAQEFLRRALETNPKFHVAYAETARQTLDRINQRQSQISAREVANAH
jgi:Tfp pilus assembly protein PilF